MSTYYRTVWHDILHVGIVAEVVEKVIKDIMVAPSRKTLVDTIPLAIFSWQRPPLSASAQHPERGFDKTSTVYFVADIDTRVFPQERQNLLPLIIA
jgi:hypothetical protein